LVLDNSLIKREVSKKLMIYECQQGHICFSNNDDLDRCAMTGCTKSTIVISTIDIDWFYKISELGLCVERKDLHKIIEDLNMPKDVKKQITKIFSHL
jgi:hypothetical protein